ncbi:uncharacterized protein P174DRAFT_455572, partial [Aspergillus novofumigatus IBT 16806]
MLRRIMVLASFPWKDAISCRFCMTACLTKSFVHTKAIIKNVTQFPDPVEVCLADGTVETGDMVLSCDGVHSLMRSFMWDQQHR